tara:strand:- start:3181 stop:3684 length:504 start_codon:yes stop_codon:yes gene_type:complete
MKNLVLIVPVIILITVLFYYSQTDNAIFKGIPTGNGPLQNRILTVSKNGELIQSNSLNEIDNFHNRTLLNLMYQGAQLRKYVNTKDASITKSYSDNDKVHNQQIAKIKSELKDLITHVNNRDRLMAGANGKFSDAFFNGTTQGFVIGKPSPYYYAAVATPYKIKHIV